jgi:hypothetical protein
VDADTARSRGQQPMSARGRREGRGGGGRGGAGKERVCLHGRAGSVRTLECVRVDGFLPPRMLKTVRGLNTDARGRPDNVHARSDGKFYCRTSF